MSKKLYIGNLSFVTTEETLSSLFSSYGNIISATVIKDKDTAQSKGFGFVEFDDNANCGKAIAELGGKEVDGRKIRVNYAEEKKSMPRSGRSFSRDRDNSRY